MAPFAPRPRAGFTLAELLVAVGILVLLTLGLYAALANGVSIWRKGESRRQTEEEGRAVLAQLASDLESIHAIEPAGNPLPGFMARVNPAGDVLLVFVRRRGAKDDDPSTRQGGDGLPSDGYDAWWTPGGAGDPDSRFRALGGLSECFYFYLASSETLLRGERAPLGGSGSFFGARDLATFQSAGRPVSKNLLALEILFWGPQTTTWDPRVQPQAGGPLATWDSTCQVEADFRYQGDPDAIRLRGAFLPSKIRISVVVASPDGGERAANLARPLEIEEGVLQVNRADRFPAPDDTPFPFLKVEDEWVRYSDKSGDRFSLVQRGARGTQAAAHPTTRGSSPVRVRTGRLYGLTVDVPVAGSAWR